MQIARKDRLREILDEVARGSSLERVLGLVADQVAADLSAPTCKIWVVKRGDICDHCPLAASCSNRQICMHLVAASGAAIDKEYPRIPLSLFNASMIARGGTSDFTDAAGVGEKLFGLQHGASNEARDSYGLYPLRGASGTVGLIGLFNHRAIRADEMQHIAQLAPAAVAAIRVAEIQSRYDSLRSRLDSFEQAAAQARAAEQQAAARQSELEDAVADLTQQVAQLQVSRDSLTRAKEEFASRAAALEEENLKLREQAAALESMQQDNSRAYSEMAVQFEAERKRLEDETSWLKGRVGALEREIEEARAERELMAKQRAERDLMLEQARVELEAAQSVGEEVVRLQQRIAMLEESNAGLRDHNAAITESVDDLERSLRIAEDARARLEQARVRLEEDAAAAAQEAEQLRRENLRVSSENEQLLEEVARLNADIAQLQEREQSRLLHLESENAALTEANAQLLQAVKHFESKVTLIEESAAKLRDRAEANERARSELEQRNRTLAEQNRRLTADSQSKARFLAHMSHELRTPMNAIIGFTSLLSEDRSLQLSDRHRRSLERVSRNARDLLELINNVLDFSKIEAGRMDVYSEPTDARDLIERALGVVEPLKDNRPVRLSFEVEDDLPTLRTDRTKLQQILINLLSNAIKFTPEGDVKVTARRNGAGQISVSVSDTGIGIDEADLAKVFEEFQQVGAHNRGARTGTGLGLTITRRLVELLGGSISVSSRLGEGSVFTITLPIEIEGRAAPDLADAETQALDPQRTALIIDSDPASLFLTKKYLAESGYSVAATDDPAQGAEVARLAAPALIIIDLDMADGGLALVEQVAAISNGRTIVAVSSDQAMEQAALSAGAGVFLPKPIERAELLRSVEQAAKASQGSVLVVDDDPDALDLVVAMLESSDYEIHTATNGRQALDEIARSRIDAIILDLMLPEMDGFEVVHRLSLNAEWRAIPVILLTARDLSHEERRALDIGTARIIQKGNFSRDELMGEVRGLIAKKRGLAAQAEGK